MHNFTIKVYFSKFIGFLFFLMFSFGTIQVDAQITINEDVFTKWIGKSYKEVLYETNLDIDAQLAEIKAAVGPDQVWDFSNLNYVDSTVIINEIMEVDPADPLLENEELAGSQYVNKITVLPGSGGVEDTTRTYIYTSLVNGVWIVNGNFTMIDLDLDGTLDPALQFFTPPFLEVPFPVTSTSEWFDSTGLTTVFDGMEFLGSIMIDSTWVRGYGTLITPQGTAEALRVHNKNLTKNPFLPIVDESNDYDFVTADDMISASIVVEDGRAFHSIKRPIGPTSTYDIADLKFIVNQASPNPFYETLNVNVNMKEAGNVQFQLISVDGTIKSLLKKDYLPTGNQRVQLSIKDVPSGMYYLQVRSGRFIQHLAVNKI